MTKYYYPISPKKYNTYSKNARNSNSTFFSKNEKTEESWGIKRQVWLNNLMFLLAPEACIFILEKKRFQKMFKNRIDFFQFFCTIKIILKRFCLWEHFWNVNNMSKMFTRIFITRNEVSVIFLQFFCQKTININHFFVNSIQHFALKTNF